MNYLNFSQEVKRIIAQIFPKTPIKSSQFHICAQLNQYIRHSLQKLTSVLHMQQQLPHKLQVLHLDLSQVQSETYCCRAVQHIHLLYTDHGNTKTCTTYSIQEVIEISSSTEMLESQHSNKFYRSIYVLVKTGHNILFSNTKLVSAIQPYTKWHVSLSLCTKNTISCSSDADMLGRDATDKKKSVCSLPFTFCQVPFVE